MQSSGADREPDRAGSGRNQPPRAWVMVLTVAVLTVIGWAAWVALTPTAVPASQPNPSYTLKIITVTPRADPSAEAAFRRSLQLQAQQPNPFVTAIREAVGPTMSEDELNELSREVNLLLCGGGSNPTEAVNRLTEKGFARKTAEDVIAGVLAVGDC